LAHSRKPLSISNSKKPMKRFLFHFAAFCVPFVAALSLIGRYTDSRLRAHDKGRMHAWHEIAAGGVDADIIALGGSNVRMGVDPKVMDSAFPGWKTYNLGLEGYAFDIQLARYRLYMHHNKQPKIIVLGISYFEFERSQWYIDHGQFLPYCYDSSIRNALRHIGVSWLKTDVLPFRYRGEANMVIAALQHKSPLPQDENEREAGQAQQGYVPAAQHWNEAEFIRNARNPELFAPITDSNVFHVFQQFLDQCRNAGIIVFIAFTPHHSRYTALVKNAAAYRNMIRMAIADKAPMFDPTNLRDWSDTSFFYNSTHLNGKGAAHFSRLLADSLRAYMKDIPSKK
jgi:hypothetical protein